MAAGTLTAANVSFGAGTGIINFNHTATDYTFAPAITGYGTINALAGTTYLAGDLTGFTGNTNLLGGDLTYNFASGSTVGSALAGSGALTIASGGTTYLTSDSSAFTGTTTVDDGSTFSVNGTLGGALGVADGGTLKGSGTAGNVTAQSGGTVAPGNSIGTLTVATFDASPGSIYQVEIDAFGASDLIHATGTATLNGGTVEFVPASGMYRPGTRYTILTADGGRSGTFDSEVASGFLFLEAALAYDPTHVYADITRNGVSFASAAATPNQVNVAQALDLLPNSNDAYAAVAGQSDGAAARIAFDQLSGEPHASALASLAMQQHLLSDALINRMDEARGAARDAAKPFTVAYHGAYIPGIAPSQGGSSGAWVQGFGNWGALDGDGNSADTDSHTSGVLIGADGRMGDEWRGGAAIGYSHSTIDTDARRATSKSDNYHAALYAGSTARSGVALTLGSSLTWHAIDSGRTVSFPGFADCLAGEYDGWSGQAFADLSYPIALGVRGRGPSHIAPFVTAAYRHQSSGSFTEEGGAAALDVGSNSMDLLESSMGLRLHYPMLFANQPIKRVSLDGSAGWKHLAGDIAPTSTQRFVHGGVGSFTSEGSPLARNAMVYDAALNLTLDPAASVGIRYAGQLAGDAQEQSLTGNFRYAF